MKNILSIIAFCCTFFFATAQVIEVEKIKDMRAKDLVKWSGGISANSIFYTGNGEANRDPFTYYINGMLNARIANIIDVPISFNISNAGQNFNFPTAPSRIGLHPKYKNITGHVGDVSMVFSPYTLNGYQFRGAGVDVESLGNFQVSAMAGRLQKATEYDSTNQILPAAYARFGYGTKIMFKQNLYRIGVTVFGAKDKINSLQFVPDSVSIFPKQNLVISWEGAFTPIKDIEISAEYASSAMTNDLRDTFAVASGKKGYLTNLANRNNSTAFYNALKTNFNYKYENSIIGVGYERVDPGYETLGAYFFNNDLENFTVNVAQPFSKNKGQVAANIGLQRDNLDNNKIGSSKRTVYAINASYMPNKKWITSFNFSNFTTFQRIRPLFQNLNQTVTPYADLDTLNFSQVSRNANANANYILQQSAKKLQSLNANISFLTVSDRQGGVKQFGANSNLFSLATSYSIVFVPEEMSITAAFNTTTNKVANTNYVLLGPTVSFTKKLLKKLNTSFVAAYNGTTGDAAGESTVFSTRVNAGYTIKEKQNFNLSFINQFRNIKATGKTSDFIVTAGYNYFF